VLVDHARLVRAGKRGGERDRVEFDHISDPAGAAAIDWLVIDDAISRLVVEDAAAAELVRLKLFAGLSIEEAAKVLGKSRAAAYRDWAFARA